MAIETELKYLLSKRAFHRLKAALGKPLKVEVQTNCYFDTPSRALGRRRIALRLRITGKKCVLTVKRPTKNTLRSIHTPGLTSREEYECILPMPLARNLGRGRHSALLAYGPWRILESSLSKSKLQHLGEVARMHTQRSFYRMDSRTQLGRECRWNSKAVLELDSVTCANGKKFYELEVECPAPTLSPKKVRQQLQSLFALLDVKARPISRTKLARVMKEHRSM